MLRTVGNRVGWAITVALALTVLTSLVDRHTPLDLLDHPIHLERYTDG